MELWWLPSAIVFGGTAVVIAVVVSVVRRRTSLTSSHAARGAVGPLRAPLEQLERDAGVALVRADDAVADARNELSFAIAQFGDESAKPFETSVTKAAADLQQAFRLRQRLDDHIPESDAKRRELSLRIISLCSGLQEDLARHSGSFLERRRLETDAPARLSRARADAETATARLEQVGAALARAGAEYSAASVAAARVEEGAATDALGAVRADIAAAETAGQAQPVGERVLSAEEGLVRVQGHLDAVERTLAELDDTRTRLASAADALRSDIERARSTQSAATDPGFAARAGEESDAAAEMLARLDGDGGAAGSRDPVRDLQLVDTASGRLDSALAAVRNQEARLEGARTALAGALRVAQSEVGRASSLIDANRARLGPSPRTRLSEAERQLANAHDLPDPVEALDTARRAARLAEDAVDLARFELR